jgi:hypothetical protein
MPQVRRLRLHIGRAAIAAAKRNLTATVGDLEMALHGIGALGAEARVLVAKEPYCDAERSIAALHRPGGPGRYAAAWLKVHIATSEGVQTIAGGQNPSCAFSAISVKY